LNSDDIEKDYIVVKETYNNNVDIRIADWNMIGRGLFIAAESFIAFGAVAVALEILFDRGLIKRFP